MTHEERAKQTACEFFEIIPEALANDRADRAERMDRYSVIRLRVLLVREFAEVERAATARMRKACMENIVETFVEFAEKSGCREIVPQMRALLAEKVKEVTP